MATRKGGSCGPAGFERWSRGDGASAADEAQILIWSGAAFSLLWAGCEMGAKAGMRKTIVLWLGALKYRSAYGKRVIMTRQNPSLAGWPVFVDEPLRGRLMSGVVTGWEGGVR